MRKCKLRDKDNDSEIEFEFEENNRLVVSTRDGYNYTFTYIPIKSVKLYRLAQEIIKRHEELTNAT